MSDQNNQQGSNYANNYQYSYGENIDQNSYGYGQNSYNQSTYGSNYNQSAYNYGQTGYDSSGYSYGQGTYGSSSYDSNSYGGYNQQSAYSSQGTASNPISVSPNTPFTSNNQIDLHLSSLGETNAGRKDTQINTFINGVKGFLRYAQQYQIYINIYINVGSPESVTAQGIPTAVNNTTVSIGEKIVSIRHISYISFQVDPASFDISIASTFTDNRNNESTNKIEEDDMYTFLYSKRAFNQYIALSIDVLFAPQLTQLVSVSLNQDFTILKSLDTYYLIPIHKITSIE